MNTLKLLLASSVLCVALHAADAPAKQPNVLFIAVDDLNDWIGCLGGHPQSKTTNFDRLAASSVLFRNAYCAGASCNPSRAAKGGDQELYDIVSDPHEWTNLAPKAEHAAKLTEMRTLAPKE
jgi:hypothetical protein